MTKTFLWMTLAWLAVSCGGHNGNVTRFGTPVAPLTVDQQQRFAQTADAVSEATHWNAIKSTGSVSVQDAEGKAQIDKVVSDSQRCKIETTAPASGSTTGLPMESSSSVAISGPTCPIAFGNSRRTTLDDSTSDQPAFTDQMKLYYSPLTGDAQNALDIQDYKFDSRGWGRFSRSKQAISNTVSGTGTVQSKAQGAIAISLAASEQTTAKSKVAINVFRFTYADGLVVELRNEVDTQAQSTTYSLNGQALNPTVFQNYLTRFGLDQAAFTR